MVILGIDPARGWALVQHDGEHSANRTVLGAGTEPGLETLIERIRTLAEITEINCVVIERPANRHVYHRPGQSVAAMKKIAVNVGENRAKADSIFYFCDGLGLNPQFVTPIKHGTKLSSQQIEAMTGYQKRTSEHARDAIILAWHAIP
ncbi:MAG: hypothetical protein SVM79_00155 [Chloroflexota bacterium]|nr:hypothetical protein [Chloroflexota bacterium]